jgi:hypothetical protein
MKIQKNDNQGPSMSELIKSVPLLFIIHFLGWELGRSNLVWELRRHVGCSGGCQ